MALLAAMVTGSVIGVRHALETDHLAAVATLAEEDSPDRSPGVVGVSWGLGHAIPIVALGIGFVLLGIELPESVLVGLEALVGVVLIALGVRLLADVLGVETHAHGGGAHAHLRVGSARIGATHRHVDGDSLLVGVLHGFAGSGALVVAMAATASALDTAIAFLGTFGLFSIATMGVVSAAWSRTLGTRFRRPLEATAAVFGIVVGAALLAEQVTSIALL